MIPLNIETVTYQNKTFYVIQDTILPAGTKQRGIEFFQNIKDQGYNEIVTYGTVYGYGQVATAKGCKEVGLKCTLFVPSVIPRTPYTLEAMSYQPNLIEIAPWPKTSQLAKLAADYASHFPHSKLLQLGLDDPEFIESLARAISESAEGVINPKKIWVAGGSGTLARALAKAFPEATIAIVQVGMTIWPDILQQIPKHELYVAPEKYTQNAIFQPPYKSLSHYDAKVWRFVRQYGQDGDFIWNVK